TEAVKHATPVEADANASVDQLLGAIVSLQQVIDEANTHGDLSWVDDDKKYSAARIDIETLKAKLKTRASAAVRAEVEQATAKIDPLPAAPLSQTAALLAQISGRMTTMKNAMGVDEDTRTAIGGLLAKIEQQRTALEGMHGVTMALENVRQATTPDELG